MLKPLTLSVSLAVALGACGVSMAGHHNNGCSTCGLASPQGPIASPQGVMASPQGEYCGDVCAPKKKCCLSGLFKHKPKAVCYEWVLKKKHCGGLFGHKGGGCGGGGCDSCGGPDHRPAGTQPHGDPRIAMRGSFFSSEASPSRAGPLASRLTNRADCG